MKYSLLYIIPFIFLIGCKHKDQASKYIQDLNTSDTFRYEFTVNHEGEFDSIEYRHQKEFENFYKLPSLEKGFDSVQIRISYGCAMGSNLLVILLNQHKGWKAEVRRLGDNFMDSILEIHPVSKKLIFQTPRSGWKYFINELFNLKILSLEDNQRIPGFNYAIPSDGCDVGIEIATKNTYRFYSYDNPDDYNDRYWQAKNVIDILKLINKELSINTDWPSLMSEQSDTTHPIKIKMGEIEIKDVNTDSTRN